jgi:hypothetical protein
MPADAQYQAWLISPDGDVKIGPPTPSEAIAWQEVYTESTICWPTDPDIRREFFGRCRVGVVVPIHGA